MAKSVVYTTVNGQILSESRGGTVSHFVPDPLGSVVMVRDTSGNTVYEAEYDPYGNVQSEAGTNPSPLGYVGTLGYIKDSATSMYVRARYLLSNLGRWLTKDPLWPSEPGYVYAGAAPNMHIDPSGLQSSKEEFGRYCQEMDRAFRDLLKWRPGVPPVYGRYCGPQTSPGTGSPIDGTDACCKTHDDCFKKHGCNWWNQSFMRECRRCNGVLCWCLAKRASKVGGTELGANLAFQVIYCRQPFTNYPLPDF